MATSGDTGAAVAAAFAAKAKVPATILYPLGKISPYQEKQMVSVQGGGVVALAVEGDFDRCQKAAKEILAASPSAISANSISLARLLPQAAYHAWAAARLPGATLVVPSGNMGNVCSALLAKRMGAPIGHVHVACNENDGVSRYLNGEDLEYSPKPTKATPATAMDVGKPSNWVRLSRWLGVGPKTPFVSASSTPSSAIPALQEKWGVCPHTAVAHGAAEGFRASKNAPVCVLATASPVKFRRYSPRAPQDRARVLKPELLPSFPRRRIVFVGLPKTGKKTLCARFPTSIVGGDLVALSDLVVFLDCRNPDLLRSRGAVGLDEGGLEKQRRACLAKALLWVVTDHNPIDRIEATLRRLTTT